jgi:tagatose-1,6-bisphosphate aldolase
MITVCVMPNFKGTSIETLKAFATCLLLDSIYCLPLLIHYL